MYVNFEWLHPTNFKCMLNFPKSAMNTLAKFLMDFSPNMDKNIFY